MERSGRIGGWAASMGLLILAVFYLAPALRTPYWAEELSLSVGSRAVVVLGETTIWEHIPEAIRHTLLSGRFFPLSAVLMSTIHYVIRDVWWYKAFILAMNVADLALFLVLARRLTGRRDYACFAGCVALGLIQYRLTIDPSLGFYGQMQLLVALLFLSMITLLNHLERGGRGWLAASTGLFLGCALLYEVAYTLVPLHLCLILRAGPARAGVIEKSAPFLAVVAFCAFQTALTRWLHPSEVYWGNTDFDPWAVALAVVHQCSAGLPMSYLLADPQQIFPPPGAGGLWRWLAHGGGLAIALAGGALSYWSLRRGSRTDATRAIGGPWLAAVGGILASFPAFFLAISPYHRANIGFGVGWIPALIQCYGVALVLSAGLWGLVATWRLGGPGSRAKCLVAALPVALMIGATYRANEEVTRCFVAQPGTARFRTIVGNAGGGYHEQRWLLEAALKAGLMAGVPAGATVELASSYPFWYDREGGRPFLAAYAGKAFEVVAATEGPAAGEAYRLRDVFLRAGCGYVVLGHRGADGVQAVPPRLFVLHPRFGRKAGGPDFRVEPSEGGAMIEKSALRLVRQGQGWALYEMDGPREVVLADSLRVRFDRAAPPALADGGGGEARR